MDLTKLILEYVINKSVQVRRLHSTFSSLEILKGEHRSKLVGDTGLYNITHWKDHKILPPITLHSGGIIKWVPKYFHIDLITKYSLLNDSRVKRSKMDQRGEYKAKPVRNSVKSINISN